MKNSLILSLILLLLSSMAHALAEPPSKSPLYSSETVVQLEMAANFTEISRNRNTHFTTPLLFREVANPGRTFKAQARSRGNSSLSSHEKINFPKFKIEIEDSENLSGTLFAGARNFRVNTHLVTDPESENSFMGRLYGDAGPMREGLAYRLAETLGLKTPATRLARIRYKDLGSMSEFTRNALFIETNKKISERLGGQEVTLEQFATSEKSGIDPVEGALFFLFQKMIGNEDFYLRVHELVSSSEKHLMLFNVIIIERPNKTRVPVVYDLDLASMVTGREPLAENFINSLKPLKDKFTHEQLAEAIAIANSKKSALYETAERTAADKTGRELALQYLDIFFAHVHDVLN